MDSIWRDLVYSFRTLRKSWGFSLVVILILALGIGANTAIYSVVDAVLLRPLPYPSPERLVMIPAVHQPNERGIEVAAANFIDWRRESRSFEHLGVYAPSSVNLTGTETPQRIPGAVITPSGFAALGVSPLLGRVFLPEEETPDSRVAILSYGLWRNHFAADRDVLGEVIRLNENEYPIIGVMPPEFYFPSQEVQIWIPARIEAWAGDRQERFLYAFGRLEEGVSLEAAQQEMNVVTGALAEQYPAENTGWGARIVPMQEHLVGKIRPALLVLLTTVLLVLVIACANIAHLQLARATTRRTEMAIRSALGTPASGILRQLLIEGLILAGLGGLLGLLLAHWSLNLLLAWSPRYIPRVEEIGIDGPVLLFTLGISLLTGVIFALVPAISALRPDLVGELREGGPAASSGAGALRFRRLLTVAEVATALVLLVSAGLLLTSLDRLQRVEPGFSPANVLTLEVVTARARYPDAERAIFFRELAARAAQLPGVVAAGGVSNLPLSGSNASVSYRVEDRPPDDPNVLPEAGYRGVTPGYFKTLQIPLLHGREFTSQDTEETAEVMVVNQTFANRHWPGESAIGKQVTLMGRGGGRPPHVVVGVVGDVRHMSLDVPTEPEIYVSYQQRAPWDNMILTARTRSNPAELSGQLRDLVAGLDPEQPVINLKTMEAVLAESTSEPRLYSTLLAVFAGLALALSTLGIYSIISYSVAQRRHELGIRIALGARRSNVLRLVAREGVVVTAVGIVAGLILAFIVTRGLATLLFGVEPNDPLIFTGTALLLAAVALAASLIPGMRASRVSPTVTSRTQ